MCMPSGIVRRAAEKYKNVEVVYAYWYTTLCR